MEVQSQLQLFTHTEGIPMSPTIKRYHPGKCIAQVRVVRESNVERSVCCTPADADTIWREAIATRPEHDPEKEHFVVLHLDTRRKIKSWDEITVGILDESLVHPREVFRSAIVAASAAIVVMHNHPSGDPTPSAEDIQVTRKLVEAGKIVNIQVLDSMIVGEQSDDRDTPFFSLREAGLVNFEK